MGEHHIRSLQRALPFVPVRDVLIFFPREGWENEMWHAALPGQRLGFVQSEVQEVVMCFEA